MVTNYQARYECNIPTTFYKYYCGNSFFIAFILSTKSGQYDDMYTPFVRMLFDEELVKDNQDKSTLDLILNYGDATVLLQ